MPLLDPISRHKIENDYFEQTGKQAITYSEQYSNDPNDQLWGDCSPKLNMNVTLTTSSQCFDPDNPDFAAEPNQNAASTDYDLANLGGWKVTIGTNPTIIYHVRTADDQYVLRDVESKKETIYHVDGKQIRQKDAPYKHIQ